MPRIPYPIPHPPRAKNSTAVSKLLRGGGLHHFLYFQKGLEGDSDANGKTGFATPAAFEKLLTALDRHGANEFKEIKLDDPVNGRPLVNPQAGLAEDSHMPAPWYFEIPSPPEQDGKMEVTAAEMIELYWMAHLREVGFSEFETNAEVDEAATDLQDRPLYPTGDFNHPDFQSFSGKLDGKTIFRGGELDPDGGGERIGPYISQFLTLDVPFGTLKIPQIENFVAFEDQGVGGQAPHLTAKAAWVKIQNGDNPDPGSPEPPQPAPEEGSQRRIGTMLDLARYVHIDALYEAYLNAALILLGKRFNFGPGNPYSKQCPSPSGLGICAHEVKADRQMSQEGFGTFGPTHILSMVCEVATRALKAVWYQKWIAHLRLRPEVFGRFVEELKNGNKAEISAILDSDDAITILEDSIGNGAVSKVMAANGGSAYLPMVFAEGSPMHPAYGAGHATVAGACVTILKAFFDGEQKLSSKIPVAEDAKSAEAGVHLGEIDQYSNLKIDPASVEDLTVHGELNKLAANISIGRNMAGVHWRSDYTQSVLLGQRVSISMLYHQRTDFHEEPWFLDLKTFGGNTVVIANIRENQKATAVFREDPLFKELASLDGDLDGVFYLKKGKGQRFKKLLGPEDDFRSVDPSVAEFKDLQEAEAKKLKHII